MRELVSLPRLRWVSILLPAGFIVVAELVIAPLLEAAVPGVGAHLLTAALLLAGVVAFTLAIFRMLEAKERTILAHARRTEILQQIGAEAAGLLDPDRLTRLVVERARELSGADVAGFATIEADSGTLCWQHVVGSDASAVLRPARLRRGEGIAGYVAATGQLLAVADTQTELPAGLHSSTLELDGLRSALGVPVRSAGRTLGVLLMACRAPWTCDREHVDLLASLASQVATALANAELYASAQLAATRLERLIESSGDAIITTNLEGRILSWNRGAEEIYGWTREEAVGATLPMVPPDLLADARDRMHDVTSWGGVIANYETERLRRNGERIPVVVTVSPIRSTAGDIIGMLGISKDMSTHRQLEEQDRRLALLEDRERIGMELHDGAIQSLYAVGLGLEAVAQVLERDPTLARERLIRARDSLNDVIEEIRGYIVGLRPDSFEQKGLIAGLRALAQALKVTTLIETDLDVDDAAGTIFSAERAAEIYQLTHEALANVSRHASASRASVSLRPDGDAWLLRVWDDGVGFEAAAMPHRGFGLHNMRERARRLGGELSVTSRPGQGTDVRLTLPGAEEEAGSWRQVDHSAS